ncbi:MAG: hypothetical protein GXO74_00075 [Calditrichaeota bacterium]|nr:hypothetical protein [Calditrichota bacterium]
MAEEYRRKISGEEAQERYIAIVKNKLDFFPKIGKPFTLKVKDKKFETTIQPHEVWTMGPKKPQQNYRIDAKPFWEIFPLHFGQSVHITKKKDDVYVLS